MRIVVSNNASDEHEPQVWLDTYSTSGQKLPPNLISVEFISSGNRLPPIVMSRDWFQRMAYIVT